MASARVAALSLGEGARGHGSCYQYFYLLIANGTLGHPVQNRVLRRRVARSSADPTLTRASAFPQTERYL
jgi:hypothetical protein